MNPPVSEAATALPQPWLDSAIAAIEQGQMLCEQKRWGEVVRLCQQAIQILEPGTATAYRLLGWAMQEQGNLAEAEAFYHKAIAIQPTFAENHARLGSLYAAQNRWTEAIGCYQQAIALDPEFVGAYLKLGEAWQQQGDLGQATASFLQAFRRQPDLLSPAEYWQLGDRLKAQENWAAAIETYRRALSQDPQLLSAWVSLGDTLLQQGQIGAAIDCYREAMQHHPGEPALTMQLGNLLANQGQTDEAIVLQRQTVLQRGWQQGHRYQFTRDWFTHNLSQWLTLLNAYAHQPDLHFLEVGSFEGMASCWLLDHILTSASAKLTTIDPSYQPLFDVNLSQTGSVQKVNKLIGSSHDVLPTLPAAAFEVIYIDGCHLANHVRQDAQLAWTLLKPGGLMIFDDYLWSDPQFPAADPRLGIDAFLDSIPNQFEKVYQMYQLVIRKLI